MKHFLAICWLFTGLCANGQAPAPSVGSGETRQDTPLGAPSGTPSGLIKKSIFFGGGSYFVDEEQTQELFDLLDTIPNIDLYQISIYSHTDNIGSRLYNKWLSEMRSQAAFEKLLMKNIPIEHITIKAFGEENPYFDNAQLEGLLLNRRVDIIFWPIVF